MIPLRGQKSLPFLDQPSSAARKPMRENPGAEPVDGRASSSQILPARQGRRPDSQPILCPPCDQPARLMRRIGRKSWFKCERCGQKIESTEPGGNGGDA